MLGQDFLEILARHAQQRGGPVGVGVVGAALAVEHRNLAKPDPGFDVGERDLLARQRGGAHAHRALAHRRPFGGRVAAGGDQVAVLEASDESASEDVVPQ